MAGLFGLNAVACDRGHVDSNDRVPKLRYNGSFQSLPETEMLLRISSSLHNKFEKYLDYRKAGIVNKNDLYIIALNRDALDFSDPGIPLIYKALFGVEYWSIPISPLKREEGKKYGEPFWSWRENVSKRNGSDIIPFLKPNYVLY